MTGKKFYRKYKGSKVKDRRSPEFEGIICGYVNWAVVIGITGNQPGWDFEEEEYRERFNIDRLYEKGYWAIDKEEIIFLTYPFRFGK